MKRDPFYTESEMIRTAAEALLGYRPEMTITATGIYATATRRITIDFRDDDVGPMIGGRGATKLALQTMIAAPFGGDACQIQIHTTRLVNRIQDDCSIDEGIRRMAAFLEATKAHLGPAGFQARIERSASVVVVLAAAKDPMLEQLRGAMAKIVRSIGKRHGFIATTAIEKDLPTPTH